MSKERRCETCDRWTRVWPHLGIPPYGDCGLRKPMLTRERDICPCWWSEPEPVNSEQPATRCGQCAYWKHLINGWGQCYGYDKGNTPKDIRCIGESEGRPLVYSTANGPCPKRNDGNKPDISRTCGTCRHWNRTGMLAPHFGQCRVCSDLYPASDHVCDRALWEIERRKGAPDAP